MRATQPTRIVHELALCTPVEFNFKGTCKNGYMDDAAHDQLKAVGDAVAHGHPALKGVVHCRAACAVPACFTSASRWGLWTCTSTYGSGQQERTGQVREFAEGVHKANDAQAVIDTGMNLKLESWFSWSVIGSSGTSCRSSNSSLLM